MRDRSRRSSCLRIDQPLVPLILPIEHQQVECVEARLTTTERQILELWSATTVETDDFAIDHGWLQQNRGLRREKLIQSLIAA
ncbi:MAG TPA: hypothetical protein VFF64_27235 [Candidatus Eremiobacteraceae bacterium]|nr:hypothetical protein [Candidatus Eremiobacteraceae bacterium]